MACGGAPSDTVHVPPRPQCALAALLLAPLLAASAHGPPTLDRPRLVRVMDGILAGARIETLPVPYATTFQQRSANGLSLVIARSGNLADAVGKSIANPFIFTNLDVVKQGAVDPGADRASM